MTPRLFVPCALLLLLSAFPAAGASRLKEVADLRGVRDNALLGYGLVVGLSGSGDSERVLFTSQSLSALLGKLGVRIDPREARARNVAAVMVTAKLPTYARTGSTLDVQVASIGNARSLAGGMLLLTPLGAPDGNTYAVAQGPVQTGGFEAGGGGTLVRKNLPTAGRIPGGATVERSVEVDLGQGPLVLQLRQPDFTTAARVAAAVDRVLGEKVARAADAASIEITVPEKERADLIGFIARMEATEVEVDAPARVVVSERTGTVVAGTGVRLRPAAVAHGGLQIVIGEQPVVSQPYGFSQGRTAVEHLRSVQAQETSLPVTALPATTTVQDLAKALNTLGASPRDLVAILQALKSAGALEGELEVL